MLEPILGSLMVHLKYQYNERRRRKQWKRLTSDTIGKSVAIVLSLVYSFPTVQSEISGGRSQITGNFTINEANDLSNILKSESCQRRLELLKKRS